MNASLVGTLGALLLVSSAAAGCTLTSEPVGRLDLSLSMSTTDVNADSGAVVRVAALNRGAGPVSLETLGGCVVAHRLVGPDGAPFTTSRQYGCASILRVVAVGPGDSIVGLFPIDPRPFRGETGTSRWPAGTYQVVGQLLGRHAAVVEETSPLEFRLTCHDPTWSQC